MFRRLPDTLPRDPVVPADLQTLGYFITEKDQIRQRSQPGKKYEYAVSTSERVNELHKEAINTCIREIVDERLTDLGMEEVRLPLGVGEKDKHIPILVSKDIASKDRVVVILGERHNDLGIFSYRQIGEDGINMGSAYNLVNTILHGPAPAAGHTTPGVILANTGQLLWYRGGSRAVSWTTWTHLPKESAVMDMMRVDEVKNKVPGNRDYVEHIRYLFDHILVEIANPTAKVDIIGLELSGKAALVYLAENWSTWSSRISAICLGNPVSAIQEILDESNASQESDDAFIDFISKKCRGYLISESSIDTPLSGREIYGCNCYASGEELYHENIIVRGWPAMLDWFNIVHALPDFEEAELFIDDETNGENGVEELPN